MKKSYYNTLIVLIIILISARTSTLVKSDILLVGFAISLLLYAWVNSYLHSFQKFIYVFIFLSSFAFVELLFFENVNYLTYLRIATRVLIVFLAFNIVNNFWKVFEKIVFTLVVISLIIFPIQVLVPNIVVGLLTPINSVLNSSGSESLSGLIYTFHHTFLRSDYIARNSGFMWEPGAYAGMIMISMSILLLQSGFQKQLIKRYLIYIVALISTFSTMGYISLVVFILVVAVELRSVSLQGVLFFLIIGVVSGVYIYQLPFVAQKIERETENAKVAYDGSINKSVKDKMSLGRFGSLQSGFILLQENPFFGIGLDDSRRLGGIGYYQWTNGLVDYTLKFGLIGLFILILNLHKSVQKIRFTPNNRISNMLIVLIFLMILFSNPIGILPVYIALQLTFYFNKSLSQQFFLKE